MYKLKKVVRDPGNQWYQIVDERKRAHVDVEGKTKAEYLLWCLNNSKQVKALQKVEENG